MGEGHLQKLMQYVEMFRYPRDPFGHITIKKGKGGEKDDTKVLCKPSELKRHLMMHTQQTNSADN